MKKQTVLGLGGLFFIPFLPSCQWANRMFSASPEEDLKKTALMIPSLQVATEECYYLDEFMPVPHSLVAGKSGQMSIRYYTYHKAYYKDWSQGSLRLAFSSQDNRCWSLTGEEKLQD
jgi:hypothetical protein